MQTLRVSQGSFATVTANQASLRGAPGVRQVRLVRQVRHKRRPSAVSSSTQVSRACTGAAEQDVPGKIIFFGNKIILFVIGFFVKKIIL